MAFASVVIDVVDKASSKLKKVNDASKKLSRSFNVLEKRNKGITRGFKGLAKVVAAVGLVEFGRRSVATAANFQKLELRLKLLTEATGQFSDAQKIATKGQELFGISATEALDGVTNITARLLPLGVSLQDIETTFIGFNTAAKLGGASAIEASNAFRQLAQALGSGRLAGDEFRSVSEQVPLILKPLADELNVSTGELKELAAQGKLTSEVVIRALRKLGKSGADDLKKILENDPTQVFKNLQNEIEQFQISIGKALLPATKLATSSLTNLIAVINAIPPEITSFVVVTATLVGAITIALPVIKAVIGTLTTLKTIAVGVAAVMGGPLTLAILGIGALITKFTVDIVKHNKEQKKLKELLEKGTQAQLDERLAVEENTLAQLKNTTARGNAKKGIMRQIEEQEKLIKKIKEASKAAQPTEKDKEDISKEDQLIAFLNRDKTKVDPNMKKKALESVEQSKILKTLRRQIEVKKIEDEIDRQILERKFELTDQLREINKIKDEKIRKDSLEAANANFLLDIQDLQTQKLREQNQVALELGQTIRTGLIDGIKGAINGTQTFGQAMTNVLNNLKNKLMDKALNNLFDSIGGSLFKNKKSGGGGFFSNVLGGIFGKKAQGGPVVGGRSYVVGERGPEIFSPRGSGNITPNGSLGGTTNMITVNVDANQSNVAGNNADANQLGNQIAIAIQTELIKQKRAGGLLA